MPKKIKKSKPEEELEDLEYIGAIDDFKMPEWMECTWRRIPCGKDDCKICGPIKRDRKQHIVRGEDPDSLESALEDVGRNLKETLRMIKEDATRKGFDITNINDIQEPPEPEEFPLYKEVDDWRGSVKGLLEEAWEKGELWAETEAAADLSWYKDTIAGKTYRQLSNKWHIEHGDGYGDFDYKYTKYVLSECLRILKNTLNELVSLKSPQKVGLMMALAGLSGIEEKILSI